MELHRSADAATTGRAQVLVIDDDAFVRRTIARVLSPEHDVCAVADGLAALDLVRTGARFDTIICDVMMPEMDGVQFHAELLRAAPDQARRMAFLTGGGYSAHIQERLELSRCPVLEKPFTKAALLSCVRYLRPGEQPDGPNRPGLVIGSAAVALF